MSVNDRLLARLRARLGALTVELEYAIAQLEVSQAENADLQARLAEFTNGVDAPKRKHAKKSAAA